MAKKTLDLECWENTGKTVNCFPSKTYNLQALFSVTFSGHPV